MMRTTAFHEYVDLLSSILFGTDMAAGDNLEPAR